jgi:hypothetical protein
VDPGAPSLESSVYTPNAEDLAAQCLKRILQTTESMTTEDVNREVFSAVRERFGQPQATNDYDFPAFTLESSVQASGQGLLEFVLAPHYLLCSSAIGYIRFGAETRVFLSRLDDYVAYPYHALRGVAVTRSSGRIVFVVSNGFVEFLQKQSDRNYKSHFGDLVLGTGQVGPDHDLLWPKSAEDQLFSLMATAASGYGLPMTSDSITLDPSATEFIGFKRAEPCGIEFRDGDEFVRFNPLGLEISEDGESYRFAAARVVQGFALDSEGRVCALYRKESGFTPPHETKLVRFLSEEEQQRESDALNVLAVLPSATELGT